MQVCFLPLPLIGEIERLEVRCGRDHVDVCEFRRLNDLLRLNVGARSEQHFAPAFE